MQHPFSVDILSFIQKTAFHTAPDNYSTYKQAQKRKTGFLPGSLYTESQFCCFKQPVTIPVIIQGRIFS